MSLPPKPSYLKIWIIAARPKTLFASLAPVLMGLGMAWGDRHFHTGIALLTVFCGVAVQVSANFINDYFDFLKGADEKNRLGPLRVTQAGWVNATQMRIAIAVSLGLGLVGGALLAIHGGWPIAVVTALSLLFAFLYTGGPFPLAYVGLGDVFALVFFGPVALIATYYLQTHEVYLSTIVAGFAPGLFATALLTVNNLRDRESDKASNKKTLIVRFGAGFGRMEYIICLVLAGLIPFWLALRLGNAATALTSLALVLAIPNLRAVFKPVDGPAMNRALARTSMTEMLFAIVFVITYLI